jgi:hypothetical protein
MATIVTRTGKGSPLSTAELDANFTNLNDDKPDGAIGTGPNEMPLNQFLGGMAYQDPDNVTIGGGSATLTSLTATTVTGTSMVYNGTELNARLNPLAQAVSVQMTAAASGSNGIQVASSASIALGVDDFTFHWEGVIPVSPPASASLVCIQQGQLSSGISAAALRIPTTGLPQLYFTTTGADIIVNGTTAIPSSSVPQALKITGVVRNSGVTGVSVDFYVNGLPSGATVTTASEPTSISGITYVAGSHVARTVCNTISARIFNRALTAAEVLDLSINGVALADRGASQTEDTSWTWSNFSSTLETLTTSGTDITSAINSSGIGIASNSASGSANNGELFLAGRRYEIQFDFVRTSGTVEVKIKNDGDLSSGGQVIATLSASGYQKISFIPLTDSGFIGFYNFTSFNFSATGFKVRRIGLVSELLARNAQSNTGQILDSSGNKNHALLPASGATVVGRPVSQTREVRWTNTWAGTNELQYIGGVNQAILPANAYIESIIGTVTGATPHDIIVGDGSDADRYVTITTGLAAGTTSFTLANRTTDGTNLKLTVDPDTNATMSIAWVIRYSTLEA